MSNEMAHYACDCWDAEIHTTYGWVECVGCADRSAYDLTQHTQHSGVKLAAERQLPEPKVVDRTVVILNKSVVGKTFKQDAKIINEYFDKLTPEQIVKDVEPKLKGETFELALDGKAFKLPISAIEVKRFQETVYGKIN